MNLLQQLERVSLRDGIGDLVVGSSNFSPGGLTYAGAVLIYFGSTNWPATLDMADADVTLAGDVAGGYLAYSLCAADFDGDGIDDLAVTAPAQSFTRIIGAWKPTAQPTAKCIYSAAPITGRLRPGLTPP